MNTPAITGVFVFGFFFGLMAGPLLREHGFSDFAYIITLLLCAFVAFLLIAVAQSGQPRAGDSRKSG